MTDNIYLVFRRLNKIVSRTKNQLQILFAQWNSKILCLIHKTSNNILLSPSLFLFFFSSLFKYNPFFLKKFLYSNDVNKQVSLEICVTNTLVVKISLFIMLVGTFFFKTLTQENSTTSLTQENLRRNNFPGQKYENINLKSHRNFCIK